MIKIYFLSFITISLSTLAFAEDKVIAKIDDKPILENQIREKVNDFFEVNGSVEEINNYDKLDPKSRENVIRSIILGDLIVKEAIKNKTNETSEYLKSVKFAQDQLLQKIYIEKLVAKAITENLVKEQYSRIEKEYENKYEYKVSHILVANEDEADEIVEKLKKGEKFTDLAKNNSLDPSKDEGGSLDYFSEGQMVESFEKEVLKLKIGDISKPVKTEFGFHIISLEDKRKALVPSYDELKNKILEDLTTNYIEKYLKQLEEKYKVEIINQ